MNTSELETLIRNILSEQLAPAKVEVKGNGIFPSVGEAIDAAHQAFLRYQQCPLKTRNAIINALREELTPHLASLAAESAAETGMGNKEDKFLKNKAALDNTPGIEDLTTTALTGDGGMVLFEYSPFLSPPVLIRQRPLLTTASACWRQGIAFTSVRIRVLKRFHSS